MVTDWVAFIAILIIVALVMSWVWLISGGYL
jgi:hypothetical protein